MRTKAETTSTVVDAFDRASRWLKKKLGKSRAKKAKGEQQATIEQAIADDGE
jgi:hypothetical protein